MINDTQYSLIKKLVYSVQELLNCKELDPMVKLDPETEYVIDDLLSLTEDIEADILDSYMLN